MQLQRGDPSAPAIRDPAGQPPMGRGSRPPSTCLAFAEPKEFRVSASSPDAEGEGTPAARCLFCKRSSRWGDFAGSPLAFRKRSAGSPLALRLGRRRTKGVAEAERSEREMVCSESVGLGVGTAPGVTRKPDPTSRIPTSRSASTAVFGGSGFVHARHRPSRRTSCVIAGRSARRRRPRDVRSIRIVRRRRYFPLAFYG